MSNELHKIMWIDDEIDLLKPHILFLEKKGYHIKAFNNGYDAIEELKITHYDLVLLDENMPGLSGLETLQKIKDHLPNIAIVMVTKNEEEDIMEEAIGSQITDYLIKPVNPNQILLTLKKIFHGHHIMKEKVSLNYQQSFRTLSMDILSARSYEDWMELYNRLVHWEVELERIDNAELLGILQSQKEEANQQFFKFIQKNYESWFTSEDKPILSHTVFQHVITPELSKRKPTVLLVVDNLRHDQWLTVKPLFNQFYKLKEERLYYSILPSSTQYARNAFFAGLMPSEIEKKYPNYWRNDIDEGSKNDFERELLEENLMRLGKRELNVSYDKVLNINGEKNLLKNFNRLKNQDLIVVVYNFIDILSHAKTDNKIVDQMIRDDKTYRSLTYNWFENSLLLQFIKQSAEEGYNLIVTTDHGTIYVKEPTRVVGDKETSPNLRYKLGRNLSYNTKDVFEANKPEKIFLPKVNISSKYIFAKENVFFAYPNNYNHFVNYYKDTYQHGGVSLEEMIIPLAKFEPK